MKIVSNTLGGMCGYRKVAACIRAGADGEPPAPERRVRRAMREGGMSARGRRAGRRFSSYAGEVWIGYTKLDSFVRAGRVRRSPWRTRSTPGISPTSSSGR